MPDKSYLICARYCVTFFFFSSSLFYCFKKKNVLQGQREADKIWSKEGFYAVVIFLSIFVILVTCLMVSFLFTVFCCSLLHAFLSLEDSHTFCT